MVRGKTYLKSHCDECRALDWKDYAERHPETEEARRCRTNPELRQAAKDYRETHRTEIAAWRLAKKAELYRKMNELKSFPCQDCRQTFIPFVMDWDHREPSTKRNDVAWMVDHLMNWDKILVEVAKCDLVCSNCHRVRTFNRRQGATLPLPTQPTNTELMPGEPESEPVATSGPVILVPLLLTPAGP